MSRNLLLYDISQCDVLLLMLMLSNYFKGSIDDDTLCEFYYLLSRENDIKSLCASQLMDIGIECHTPQLHVARN